MLKPSPRPDKVSNSAAGTAVPTAELNTKIKNFVQPDSIPYGNIRRKPGQVFMYAGREFVVTFVNQCRAHAEPLTLVHREGVTMDGKKFSFDSKGSGIDVSTSCHSSEVIRVEMVKHHPPSPAPAPAVVASGPRPLIPSPRPRQNATTGKPEGKLGLAKRLLLSGTMTKSQIVQELLLAFPATPEKTARNTVNWCVTDLERTDGKKSNHLKE